ncbi:hypothetical protein [Halocatena marina]|uniref:Uncharacterized protein n=1 Tax=Halocatena marina TaxID=2934937 RepID=A0ABD5YK67_9EURY|nr:hypothetical protein [Halocatena marina]
MATEIVTHDALPQRHHQRRATPTERPSPNPRMSVLNRLHMADIASKDVRQ